MFDTIIIPVTCLPVSEAEKSALEKEEFQTNDFDKDLDTLKINEHGRLLRSKFDFVLNRSTEWEDLSFEGTFSFYTVTLDGFRYDFEAFFEDGVLVKVIQVVSPN